MLCYTIHTETKEYVWKIHIVASTLCGSPIKMNVGHTSVVGNEMLYAETENMMDAQGTVNVKEIYAITAVSSDGTPKNAFYKVNQKIEYKLSKKLIIT